MERDTVPRGDGPRVHGGARRAARRAPARGARRRRGRGRRHSRPPVRGAGGRRRPRDREPGARTGPSTCAWRTTPTRLGELRRLLGLRRAYTARERGRRPRRRRRPRGRARRVRGGAPGAARQPRAGLLVRRSRSRATAARTRRCASCGRRSRPHAGWVELLKRLPEAGIYPGRPRADRPADRHAGDLGARAAPVGHVPRQGAHLRAGGAGGNGVVSFRREAHVPKGGPDGGDGGRGGDIAIVVDPSLRDLSGFRRGAHFKAKRGGHGEGANRHGATPDTLEMRVPPGTVVEDVEGGDRWELLNAGRARRRGARRQRRARQQAVRHRHAPDPALRRARPARRGAHARAAAAAEGRRRPRGAAERRQVVAARPAHARAAEGGRLPVHHDRAGARHARARRPPARGGGHPRA